MDASIWLVYDKITAEVNQNDGKTHFWIKLREATNANSHIVIHTTTYDQAVRLAHAINNPVVQAPAAEPKPEATTVQPLEEAEE